MTVALIVLFAALACGCVAYALVQSRRLDALEAKAKRDQTMTTAFQSLTDQVAATVGVEASAKAAINGVAAQLEALAASGAPTPQQILDLAAQLKASSSDLATAVASLPPEPVSPPPPPPPAPAS